LGVERSSYRYEHRPDRNIELREALVKLARQKPCYGYRRLQCFASTQRPRGQREARLCVVPNLSTNVPYSFEIQSGTAGLIKVVDFVSVKAQAIFKYRQSQNRSSLLPSFQELM
jgi:hypothetical protein